MKLTNVIKVWDLLHYRDVGDLAYCDLEKAIEKIDGIENDIPTCPPILADREERG